MTTAYRERRYFEMLLIFPLGTRRVNLGEASSDKWGMGETRECWRNNLILISQALGAGSGPIPLVDLVLENGS